MKSKNNTTLSLNSKVQQYKSPKHLEPASVKSKRPKQKYKTMIEAD